MWNIKNLEPPPTSSYKVENRNINLNELTSLFKDAQKTFTSQHYLEAEAALLSRCIYRVKLKFKNDKGLKAMSKINQALRIYLQLDYPKILRNFQNLLPSRYEKDTYFPTLNMLDYVLVRTQGLAKLLCRVADSTQVAATYIVCRIRLGHLWKVALITLGLVARIFVIVKYLTQYCCTFYKELIGMRDNFKTTQFQWLDKDYKYPNNLEDWLSVNWLKATVEEASATTNKLFDLDFDDDSDVEFCGEYTDLTKDIEIINEYYQLSEENSDIIEIKNEADKIFTKSKKILESKNKKQHIKDKNDIVKMEEDMGEALEETETTSHRKKILKKGSKMQQIIKDKVLNLDEDIGEAVTKNKIAPLVKRKEKNIRDIITEIDTIRKLNQFLKFEKIHRKANVNECKLRKLSNKQWQIVNSRVKKILKLSNAISTKFQQNKLLEIAKDSMIRTIYNFD